MRSTPLRLLVTLIAVVVLVAPFVSFLPPELFVYGVAALGLLVVARFLRNGRSDSGGSNVWNAIPSWQYTGRHVESGGLARDEQESAIEEIREQAEALEGADESIDHLE